MDLTFETKDLNEESKIRELGVDFDIYNDVIWTIISSSSIEYFQSFKSLNYIELNQRNKDKEFSLSIGNNHVLILLCISDGNGKQSIHVKEVKRTVSDSK